MMDSADPLPITEDKPVCDCCSSDMDSLTSSKQSSADPSFVDLPSAGQANDIGSGSELRGLELCADPQKTQATTSVDLHPPTDVATGTSSLTDMDCPVCFSKYDIYRIPKELSCKHTFCIVCLKLLLSHEKDTWVIPCPVCRCSTAVFGGLICTLPNKDSLMGSLEDSGLPQASQVPKVSVNIKNGSHQSGSEDSHSGVRMAAKRLTILLLILLILLIIILQFVSTGILNWVLGFILGVVAIIALVLCFGPDCKIQLLTASASQEKDNYTVSAV